MLPALIVLGKSVEFSHYPRGRLVDYSTLYLVTDQLAITTGTPWSSSLPLEIRGSVATDWILLVDGQQTSMTQTTLPLSLGTHTYTLISSAGERILITLHFSPTTLNVVTASVPVDQNVLYSLSDWTEGYNEGESLLHLERVRQMLDFINGNSPREKIRHLLILISNAAQGCLGEPSPELERMSGLAAFFELLDNGKPVWCSNLARIYCALANVAGVPSREVHAVGYQGSVTYTGHAFAESYISEEKRWVYVDPSFPDKWIADSSSQHLNAAQHLQQHDMASMSSPYFNAGTHLLYLFPRPGQRPLSFAQRLYYFLFQEKLAYSPNPHSLVSFSWGEGALFILPCLFVAGLVLLKRE